MRCRVTRYLIWIKAVDTQTTFSATLSDIEALSKWKQTRFLAEDDLFGGLKLMQNDSIAESY